MPPPIVREERPSDVATIHALTREAFAGHPHGERTEHLIVDALREAGALTLSLVAEVDGGVVGHIAFSPVAISDGSTRWFGLGPVSVLPSFQRRGIGSALVEAGLERLRAMDAHGCVLLGEPQLYSRFGFAHDPKLVLAGVPPEFFMTLSLGTSRAEGVVSYHPAFSMPAQSKDRAAE